MSRLSRIRCFLRLLLNRGGVEKELDREVRSYFEILVARQVERGVPVEEARRLARLNFEGAERVKEKVRDDWTGSALVSFARDLKYALRMIGKKRAFATVTVLTLGLGIGAATAIFSAVYAVLLRSLPYRNPHQLVLLFQSSPQDPREPLLLQDFKTLKSESQSFSDFAIYYKDTGYSRVSLTGITEPETVQGGYVSSNFFPLLGMAPSAGRAFGEDEVARSERVVVLSHALWERRFGLESEAIGKTLEINGSGFRIIGAMPAEFQFPARDVAFWAPITTNPYWFDQPTTKIGAIGQLPHVRGFYARWNALGRLKPGVSIERAQAEMKVFAKSLAEREPDLNKGLGITAVPLRVEVSGNTRLALLTLLAAVFALLVIACVNAAHLVLAYGATRGQEIAVRLSLGARQKDIFQQLLTETLALSALAGSCGVLIARALLGILVASAPADVPRLEETTLNGEVLAFAVGVSFLTAILSGFLPAWRFSRTLPNDALKTGGRTTADTSGLRRIRSYLVMAEFALTVVMLTGAGLLIRSFLAVEAVDPGFNPEHVLTVRVTLPVTRHDASFYEELLQRISRFPGVRSAGAISGLFEQGLEDSGTAQAESRQQPDTGPLRVWANWKGIRDDYFQATGIRLLGGRFFTSRDSADAPLVAVIDENMAHRYWPGENALGKQFRGHDSRGRNDDPLTVIGVVRDVRTRGRESGVTPHVFQPVAQLDRRDNPATPDLAIRAAGDPEKLAASIRSVIRAVDRSAIISSIETMEQELDQQVAPRRFQTWILSVFSLLALLLASVGIYGVTHYSVSQRTHEMGIRMALGAEPGGLFKMILREALFMMSPGVIIGLIAARWLTSLLASILFGVKATDPATYLGVTLLLMGVAILATAAPAWRAARTEPLAALRDE